jgi:hypothetical protein
MEKKVMKNGDKFRNEKGTIFTVENFEVVAVEINGINSFVIQFTLGCDVFGWDKRFRVASATGELENEWLNVFGFEAIEPLRAVAQFGYVSVTAESLTACAERIHDKGFTCQITDKGDGLYQVQSNSGNGYGVFYNFFTDEAKCSCPDFGKNRLAKNEICKHILSVAQFDTAQTEINRRVSANQRFAQTVVSDWKKAA